MTLACVWLGDNRLYAIADTRIGYSSGEILTDHGPKLLPLSILCRQPGPAGFYDREVFRTTLGFAFAGSTLAGLATHALANALLQNLIGPPGSVIPSAAEVASAVASIGERYMREIARLTEHGGLFATLIFGFCWATSRFRVFEIRPNLTRSPFQISLVEHDPSVQDSVTAIGTGPERLYERISEMRIATSYPFTHLPRRALESLVSESLLTDTVGGGVQYGWATAFGFEPVANLVKLDPPLPTGRNAALTVLGFDMDAFSGVGKYRFGIIGQA